MSNHLDPNVLAAFAGNTLTKSEKDAMFLHLGECTRCRDWFGLFQASRLKQGRRPSVFWLSARIACAVLLITVTVALLRNSRPSKPPALPAARTSWMFARDFSTQSEGITVALPAAIAATQLTKQASPLRYSRPLREPSPRSIKTNGQLFSEIPLRTSLGVRLFSLSLARAPVLAK